jgi:hypothetical protein
MRRQFIGLYPATTMDPVLGGLGLFLHFDGVKDNAKATATTGCY